MRLLRDTPGCSFWNGAKSATGILMGRVNDMMAPGMSDNFIVAVVLVVNDATHILGLHR